MWFICLSTITRQEYAGYRRTELTAFHIYSFKRFDHKWKENVQYNKIQALKNIYLIEINLFFFYHFSLRYISHKLWRRENRKSSYEELMHNLCTIFRISLYRMPDISVSYAGYLCIICLISLQLTAKRKDSKATEI